MTGWNLPPGCRESDLPGNRPEDLREEVFWEQLGAKAKKFDLAFLLEVPAVVDLIETAREMTWEEAYQEGQDDERLAQQWKEEQES